MTMLKNESLDRANADLEIVVSAYPDECRSLTNSLETKACFSDTFPLTWEIRLPDETTRLNTITLQMIDGYPIESNVQVVSYRSNEKARIEAVVQRIRETAMECQQEGIEGALSCVSAALETWEEFASTARHETAASVNLKNTLEAADVVGETTQRELKYTWISSETPLIDRKSSFVAHICRQATSELEVHEALQQLLTSTSKIQRATHNMWAYRLVDCHGILRHDNDDDGEDGAGSKLAHLLEMRQETNVVVCVSRWFGGIHLGPKRFVHISNVARDLLVRHAE